MEREKTHKIQHNTEVEGGERERTKKRQGIGEGERSGEGMGRKTLTIIKLEDSCY